MFDSIRSHRRWLMLFLLLLVFPSFVVTGIYGYNRFVGDENAVAKVDGQPITQPEWDAAHRQQVERLRGMFGANFDPKMFDTPAARSAALDSLVSDRTLQREVEREHVIIGTDQLRQVLARESAFQVDGKFDYERYKQLLAAQGLTELGFEERVRGDLARQTLLQAVSASTIVPRAVSDQVRRLAEETREIRELRFDPKEFRSKVAVTDEAIKTFYDANPKDFQTQESVKAEYVILSLDDVASQLPAIAENDARAYYDQNIARYGQDEQRRASHILLTAGDNGSAKDKAGARKKADELLARVRASPAEFEKLAREQSKDPGSAAQGGDLGWFGRNMMVKPFEAAAFSLKEGQISDVVETDFGFHIIRLSGIKPAQARPFAEVRSQIEADLKREQAGKKFAEVAEQFTNGVYEQGDSLKPVADRLKLGVLTVESLTRAGVAQRPGVPQIFTPRLIDALFSAESLSKKRNTEAIEVASNTLVAARVIEHRPAAVRPLTEVREQVKTVLEGREASRLSREAGAQKLAALRAAPADAGFSPLRAVGRTQTQGLPSAAVAALMRVPADKLPAYVGADLDGGGYAVFQVLSSKLPEKADPARDQQQARALGQVFGAADDAAYIASLRTKHKAVIVTKSAAADDAKAADKSEKSEKSEKTGTAKP
jgi:peptidyl-prolyl cis-trans isomerase D